MRATAFLAATAALAATFCVGARTPLVSDASAATAESDHVSLVDEQAWGRGARVAVPTVCSLVTESAIRRDAPISPWAASLGAIDVRNRNTGARAAVRLYDERGELDLDAARSFMRVAGTELDDAAGDRRDLREPREPLDVRLIQLVARAAYHFGALRTGRSCRGAACVGASAPVMVVSATRTGSRGKHATGEALDFSLDGVRAPILAAYLRAYPKVGVGIYTHPKTQYVHLDVRDKSFHWLDGSPPGVTWRERRLSDPKQVVRDASWNDGSDLPEAGQAAWLMELTERERDAGGALVSSAPR